MKPDKIDLEAAMDSILELQEYYEETQPHAVHDINALAAAITVIDGYVNYSSDEDDE